MESRWIYSAVAENRKEHSMLSDTSEKKLNQFEDII